VGLRVVSRHAAIAVACGVIVCAALAYPAEPGAAIYPLSQVKAGQHGTGLTVFAGAKVERFDVEILGVLENAGPRQNIILARLSGGPLAGTGVLQGMSGSPVYIDGRLVGAVAFSYPYSKEPIAGIRPIEEMFDARDATRASTVSPLKRDGQAMIEIATPLRASGISRAALDEFAPQLRAAGFEIVQGAASAASPKPAAENPSPRVEPGSMISVQLLTGDLNAGADGTVTAVEGDRIWAFGHRFMGQGETALPFARAEVVALLASLNSSFKIATSREWLGAILSDRNTAVSGRLGVHAPMIPVSVRVHGGARETNYHFEMARDRTLTPLLSQMAIASILDATERVSGPATITAQGRIALDGAKDVRIENIWSAETGVVPQAASGVAAPIAAIADSGLPTLNIRSIDLELNVTDDHREARLDSVWTSRRELRPGDRFTIYARFLTEEGREIEQSAEYAVPVGAAPGTLNITVADAATANLAEYRQFLTVAPRDAVQLSEFLNGLRTSGKAWVRLWRMGMSWSAQGETLSAVPASLALLLGRSTLAPSPGVKVAELELAGGGFAYVGSRTVQVEIKE
jgi:hypothetical protein